MIATQSRFTSALFDRCFRRSRRMRAGKMLFLISPARSSNSHFSVVVGKKYSKKAVTRNKLRRQIYEIIRKRVQPYIKGKNIICMYNGDKNPQESKILQKDFFQLVGMINRRGRERKR